MVNAILRGIKTQTRRVVKPQPIATRPSCLEWRPKGSRYVEAIGNWAPAFVWNASLDPLDTGAASIADACPHGRIGDYLWVRETFATWPEQGEGEGPGIAYRADDPSFEPLTSYWRPSIFMPRWASRITLEITGVRVQRAHDISDADILAEGIAEYAAGLGLDWSTPARRRALWEHLWDAVNGQRDGGKWAWRHDPWTWCITFRRLEGTDQ